MTEEEPPRRSDYITDEKFEQIKEFSKNKETPFLIIDLEKVEEKYDELRENLPYAKIYYAVKSNPTEEVVKLLAKKGSNFDIASIYELNQLLGYGVSPERLSFGNTIKKASAIKYAYEKGIKLFATDSENDIKKIAKNAPGSKVYFRILCDGSGADWPLSRKFGTHPDMAFSLAKKAKELGLIPYGISFHVGSQQREIGRWDDAISQCRYLFESLRKEGINLKMINMGGGFPAKYKFPTSEIKEYAKEITRFLEEDFPEKVPEIFIEPGRSLVGDSGVIVTEVVLISKKARVSPYRWVYLDIGKFQGMIETLDEAIKYPIYTERKGEEKEVILAGPTCDSMDILYEDYKYRLPISLKEKDRLYILATGAYTASYSSICFNGFPPLKVYTIKSK
jgi:ornithine decarboxylase